jgi:hypothetical protein
MRVIDSLRTWYEDWKRLAYLSPHERRRNRALWGLLVIALTYALVHHICLVNIPSPMSWGPPVGVVIYELAIAYAGAFIFYLLVVRLPLRRDRRNVYQHLGPLIGLILGHASGLMMSLNNAAGIEPPNREDTWPNIQEMCSKISPNSPAPDTVIITPAGGGAKMPPIRMQSNTVLGVIVDRMNRTRAGINEILGFAPFLATELIDLLVAIQKFSHFRAFDELTQLTQQTGAGVGNKDLSVWAKQMRDYLKLIRDLADYAREFGLTTTYQTRPGLIAGTERDPDPE